MNICFTSDLDVKKVVEFMAGPRLWIPRSSYPDFMDWLDKTSIEIQSGIKRGICCYYDRKLIGSVIYQKHKTIPNFLELKNLTISPEYGRRFIASFLVRNVEAEGKGKFSHIICDAKRDNIVMEKFLTSNKYKTVANIDLYGLNAGTDAIYLKELK